MTALVNDRGRLLEDKGSDCGARIIWACPPSSTEKVDLESETVVHGSLTNNSDEIPAIYLGVENSTKEIFGSEELDKRIESLFKAGGEGFCDENAEWEFQEAISATVRQYGDIAVASIAPFIIGERAIAEVAVQTLRSLSHIQSRVSYNFRIWLILRALQSSSSWIRDAAALAVENMADPDSIPYVKEAMDKEANAELKRYMGSVLEYLQTLQ